ncbi:unnamed protein product [Clavelina lepadiformis]|uniref:Protein kinase domain-containing protein n=1 Tax=Clavelina lepadiformis TaxID=159417 RepID=A0ABP0FGU3_CLALP
MTSVLINSYEASSLMTSCDDEDIIGSGTFALVRKCVHQQLGVVAVKCFSFGESAQTRSQTSEKVKMEANVLYQFRHDNIVKILGITQWGNCSGIILEFIESGSLDDFLMSSNVSHIPWPLRLRFFNEISTALAYLHHYDPRKAFVHCDLKPQNILLTPDLTIKIADFGATNMAVASGMADTSFVVVPNTQHTPFYTAPELLRNPLLERNTPMDVYSVGMIGYEILTRHHVFQNAIDHQLAIQLIIDRKLKPAEKYLDAVEALLDNKPEEFEVFLLLKDLMTQCWAYEPQNRPDIRDVRNKTGSRMHFVKHPQQVYKMSDLKQQIQPEKTESSMKMKLSEISYPFLERPAPSNQSSLSSAPSLPEINSSVEVNHSQRSPYSKLADPDTSCANPPGYETACADLPSYSNHPPPSSALKKEHLPFTEPPQLQTPAPLSAVGVSLLPTQASDYLPTSESEMNELLEELKKFSVKLKKKSDRRSLLKLWHRVAEINNGGLTGKAAALCPEKLKLSNVAMTDEDVSAFCFILKNVGKHLKCIDLESCKLDENSFPQISKVISQMEPEQIDDLDISFNRLQPHNTSDVISLLPTVQKSLMMIDCYQSTFSGHRNADLSERHKLKDAVGKLEYSKLVISWCFSHTIEAKNAAESDCIVM